MNIADVLRTLALMARTPEEIEDHGYEGLRVCVASVHEDGGIAGRGVSLDEFAREFMEQVAQRPVVVVLPGAGTADSKPVYGVIVSNESHTYVNEGGPWQHPDAGS